MIEFISQPWPWYVAGPIIALVMFSLLLFGKRFGISSSLRNACSVLGAGKHCAYFDLNWRDYTWGFVFALGLIIGGYVAANYLMPDGSVGISQETIKELSAMGISDPGGEFVPPEIFNWGSLLTVRGFIMLVVGGFCVGFGTRYAEGCTSGHSISGLSELQLASLIATIFFFVGGLLATYFIIPHLI